MLLLGPFLLMFEWGQLFVEEFFVGREGDELASPEASIVFAYLENFSHSHWFLSPLGWNFHHFGVPRLARLTAEDFISRAVWFST